MNRLEGKVAVVTGATSGIGEATVDAFCSEGAKVVFCGRNQELGKQVEDRQPNGSAVFVQADVLSEEEIAKVIQTAADKWGRLDILFNNAGGPSNMPGRPHAFNIEDVDEETFKYSQWYLLGSIMVATKHASPIMRKQGSGSIINNSSKGAHQAEPAADPLYSRCKSRGLQLYKGGRHAIGSFRNSGKCRKSRCNSNANFLGWTHTWTANHSGPQDQSH